MNIHWLTILGIILIGIGTLFTILGQQKNTDISNQQLNNKTDRIQTLSEENIQLNKEINKLNSKISGYLTGDSFCVATFEKYNDELEIVNINISNEGENPLYDLTMSITEIEDDPKGKVFKNAEEFYRELVKDLTTNLGTIAPKHGRMFPVRWPYLKKTNRNYNITFNTRNGDFTQFSRSLFVNGQWRTAIRVFRQNPDNPLYEKVDPEYPRNEKGEVKWQ